MNCGMAVLIIVFLILGAIFAAILLAELIFWLDRKRWK